MLIANDTKKNNIVEYVLLIWQVENLLRAFQFDMQIVEEKLILPQGYDENTIDQEKEWYADIILQMKMERIEKEGHLSFTKDIVMELAFLHQSLLNELNDREYKQLYTLCASDIVELKKKQKGSTKNDIDSCITGLYMYWLLKLSKQEISVETATAMNKLAKLMGYLSKKYKELMYLKN
jgi:hypothetical protein